MIKAIISNLGKTYSLKPKYYTLTSIIGLSGVFLGLFLGVVLFFSLANTFGINLDEPVSGGLNKAIMLLSVVFGFSFFIYLGCVIVAGVFSIAMVACNKFTIKQAIEYTFLSSYPDSWLKEGS